MAQAALLAAPSVIGAGASLFKGSADKKAAKFEQAQLNKQAERVLGAGSREAYELGRQGEILKDDVTAARAAGGGSSDAGSIERLARIETEARYNALSALYDADEEAEQLREQGREARKAGNRAQIAGFIGAAGSIIDGAGKSF